MIFNQKYEEYKEFKQAINPKKVEENQHYQRMRSIFTVPDNFGEILQSEIDIILKSNAHKSINEDENQAAELKVEELNNQNKKANNQNIEELKQNKKEKDLNKKRRKQRAQSIIIKDVELDRGQVAMK